MPLQFERFDKEKTVMLAQTVENALNQQIKNELYSAYLYLSMSAFFEAKSLRGFAHWMRLQGQEEVSHALKFFDFVHDRGGRVTLQAIDQPPTDFQSPLEVWQQALEHERKVTAMIEQLYVLAVKEKDYATQNLLQWFVDEQVEEEKNASVVVEQLKMIGDNAPAVLMLDKQLGERTT